MRVPYLQCIHAVETTISRRMLFFFLFLRLLLQRLRNRSTAKWGRFQPNNRGLRSQLVKTGDLGIPIEEFLQLPPLMKRRAPCAVSTTAGCRAGLGFRLLPLPSSSTMTRLLICFRRRLMLSATSVAAALISPLEPLLQQQSRVRGSRKWNGKHGSSRVVEKLFSHLILCIFFFPCVFYQRRWKL